MFIVNLVNDCVSQNPPQPAISGNPLPLRPSPGDDVAERKWWRVFFLDCFVCVFKLKKSSPGSCRKPIQMAFLFKTYTRFNIPLLKNFFWTDVRITISFTCEVNLESSIEVSLWSKVVCLFSNSPLLSEHTCSGPVWVWNPQQEFCCVRQHQR